MAGWTSFLEERLLGAGFSEGAILSEAGEPYAASRGLSVSPADAALVRGALRGDGDAAAALRAAGFEVGGTRYAVARIECDDNADFKYLIARGKEKGEPATGVIVAQTYKATIFAMHDPLHSPDLSFARANVVVTVLADQLMAQDY